MIVSFPILFSVMNVNFELSLQRFCFALSFQIITYPFFFTIRVKTRQKSHNDQQRVTNSVFLVLIEITS